MNDNDTTIDRDAPNSSSEPSSSSSSQSDDSSATTSSSSQSSSSEATSIEARGERVSKPTTMLDTDGSISSNKSNRATIISSESVRRYKNSPFGLGRHHFLTMPATDPEPAAANQGNKPRGAQRSARRDWKKRRPADPYRNLSLIAPVFASASQSPLSSPSWRNYTAEQKQSKTTTTTAANHGDGARGANDVEPAYDAGLDAERCNSKASRHQDDYFAADSSRQVAGAGTTASPVGGKGSSLAADEKAEDYDCLLVRFSSIMYATFLVILGCILHCSELRQKSKNSTDHIYTIIVALMGIAWLLFLQGDLHRYKRYASKYILIESIFNDHRQKLRQLSIDSPADSAARSTASSAASLINDRMSMNTEVIFKKTAYKMYQRRAAALNNHLPSQDNCSTLDLPFRMSSKARNFLGPNDDKASNKQASSKRIESDVAVAENLVPAYKFLHGKMGANFYLKCGMAAFCFGHVIHEGLRFGQQLYFFGTGNLHCRDSVALVAHLITPLYSFYQLFMMFKYSNLVINRYRVLAKFGLMHIVGTSVTFWIRTILEEAYEDFVHKMDYFKSHKLQNGTTNSSSTSVLADPSLVAVLQSALSSAISTEASERSEQQLLSNRLPANNITTTVAQSIWALMSSPISATITPQIARQLPESYACAQNTLLTTRSMNALPYLYPFTIEYNLLLAATFLSLYFNIGKIGSHGTSGACQLPSIGGHPGGGFVKRVRHQSGSSSSFTNSPVSSSHHQESCDNVSTSKGAKDLGEYKSNFVVNADCHSANKGLFCGFFVLLVTLVTIVIFFVTINKPTHVQLGIKINLIQEGVLTTLILIVMVIGFKQVSKLNRNPFLRDKVTTDDVLMLIPLPFFFFHSLLSFRAETASLYQSMPIQSPLTSHEPARIHSINVNSNNQVIDITNTKSNSHMNRLVMSHRNISNGQLIENFINDTSGKTDIRGGDHSNRKGMGSSNINVGNDSSQIDHFKLINVALNIVVMIEVLVQTNFIIDGMRRCSESRYLRFKKPGRELITFAILLNITYWIVATFETKSVEQYKPEIEYYGPLPYMFISHTTLPVMLFYRYHSSVCLAEIWNRAYKPPKRR